MQLSPRFLLSKNVLMGIVLSLGSRVLFGQSAPAAVIPFTVKDNCIYLHCTINATDSLTFLFDTGADGSVINGASGVAQKLARSGTSLNVGSNGQNVVDQSTGNTITFGSLRKANATFTIIPYETTAFDGVFGTDLMAGYVIEINYQKKELRFYDTAQQVDLSGYSRHKLRFIGNYPAIRCSITAQNQRYTGWFGLDTGADNVLTVSSPFVRQHGLLGKLQKIGSSVSQGSDGSSYENPIALASAIHVGKQPFYRLPIDLSQSTEGIDAADKAGYWGNNFLKRFDAVWDFPNRTLYLRPNNNLYTKFF
jgi:hypothetical protein